jgi:hypothetical protein
MAESYSLYNAETLGFGANRPEWLRNNNNDLAVRGEIKSNSSADTKIM